MSASKEQLIIRIESARERARQLTEGSNEKSEVDREVASLLSFLNELNKSEGKVLKG